MTSRRDFLARLGATVLVPAVPLSAGTSDSSAPAFSTKARVQLNGEWDLLIDNQFYEKITVPSSLSPIGLYSLKRAFLLPRLQEGQRALVHFEGINYAGRLSVNGAKLGTMSPYIPHEFEITSIAKEGKNEIELQIADLVPFPDGGGKDELHIGINPGWEAYGGIIRDVWVDIRPSAFIQTVSFAYQLSRNYLQASCQAKAYISSSKPAGGRVEVALRCGAAEVARASSDVALRSGDNQAELTFEVKEPSLWSPEEPHLYDLVATLESDGVSNEWSCRTGFREFKIEGTEFRLNAKKVILNGVCRHDLWKGQGFTLTRGQQEQDMRMIKALGCNFVRLVHYPHDRHIVELADELGLMVSEEPGYWQVDFAKIPQSEIELGYHTLDETIKRDWNSPSVVIWFLSNECRLTEEAMRVGKERCRKIDPIGRLVSVASDTNRKKSKPLFEASGMDFFDQHLYTYNVDDFNQEADFDGPGKPLTFSEWGGKAIGQSPQVMKGTEAG